MVLLSTVNLMKEVFAVKDTTDCPEIIFTIVKNERLHDEDRQVRLTRNVAVNKLLDWLFVSYCENSN